MLEERVVDFLVSWLSSVMQKVVQGVWSQVPQNPFFPYLKIGLEDVEALAHEHRIRAVFTLTIVSTYKGQKETLYILGCLKESLEQTLHSKGVFKIDQQSPSEIETDNMTRKTKIRVSCLLSQEI